MKPKQIIKIIIDISMTVLLLLLMAYSLIGEAAHEWLSVGIFLMFALFLLDYAAIMGVVCLDRILYHGNIAKELNEKIIVM